MSGRCARGGSADYPDEDCKSKARNTAILDQLPGLFPGERTDYVVQDGKVIIVNLSAG